MTVVCPPGYHVEEICVADPVAQPQWTDLGAHPTIAANPTAYGKQIVQCHPFAGRVYLGYGDWTSGKQDGCDLAYWDGTAFGSVGHYATDAFWSLRTIAGDLWAIATDPEVGADPDAVIVAPDGSANTLWASRSPYPWHLFDGCDFGGHVYLAGALRAGSGASLGTVWRSPLPLLIPATTGAYWQTPLSRAAYRCYAVFPLGGALWAIFTDGSAWSSPDGTVWTRAAASFPGTPTTKPMPYAGGVVLRLGWPADGTGTLVRFDGQTRADLAVVRDHFVDPDGALWTLTDTAIGRDGTPVAQPPANARSLCVLDGAVYAGTADAHLWVYR